MNLWQLLTTEQWTVVSAVAAATSAIIAAIALFVIAGQLKAAHKTADIEALQAFLQAATEREQVLRKADTEELQTEAFYEFANFLEVYAAALHGHLFLKVTREIVEDKVVGSIALIEQIEPWMERLMAAKTSAATFKHISRFIRQHRQEIDEVKSYPANASPAEKTNDRIGAI